MENETRKEIDLIDALRDLGIGIWNLIKKAVYGAGWVVRLIYQEKLIILPIVILGVCLGIFLNKEKVYRAEVELKFNCHDSYFYKNMIDPLYNQCKYRDINTIAADFGLDKKKAGE
ncbi:MAG: hypothetical protein J6S89_03860, partial [Paludibacteraceae bacterium]|nr:hypothetical protein [Paludibacteraceae bacterium]